VKAFYLTQAEDDCTGDPKEATGGKGLRIGKFPNFVRYHHVSELVNLFFQRKILICPQIFQLPDFAKFAGNTMVSASWLICCSERKYLSMVIFQLLH
jgi:hypothetical protein